MKRTLLLLVVILMSCSPAATPTPKPNISAFASPAAQPWLAELYACADNIDVLISIDYPGSTDISLRLGEPDKLENTSFQIDEVELLVVTHPQIGLSSLSLDQIREVYSGRVRSWGEMGGNDVPIEVWVFADGEDVQQVIDQTLLEGMRVSSSAKVAISAQDMSDSVGLNPGAIGILPRRWKAGNTHEIFSIGNFPVLAITGTKPDGDLERLLACLQK